MRIFVVGLGVVAAIMLAVVATGTSSGEPRDDRQVPQNGVVGVRPLAGVNWD